MKSIITSLGFLFLVINLNAQNIDVGPKVGLNYSHLFMNESFTNENVNYNYITEKADYGILAGAFIRFNYKDFYLQPEICYSQHKSYLQMNYNDIGQEQVITINTLVVPIYAGIKFKHGIRVQGGPVFSRLIDASIVPTLPVRWLSINNPNRIDLGYTFGIGADINRVHLDLQVKNMNSTLNMEYVRNGNSQNFNYSEKGLQVTFGYKISK